MDNKIRIGNVIRSLNQMVIVINGDDFSITVEDHNAELRSIRNTGSFEGFRGDLHKNIHPEDREAFSLFTRKKRFIKELDEKLFISDEFRIRHTDSRYYWSEITICNASEEDSTEGHDYILLIRDIHEWKTRELSEEAELRRNLEDLREKYDSLFEENMKDEQTGCYNRKGLRYYTDIVIKEALKTGRHIFVCVADLNGLKYLNDTYGHAAGDEAIATVSSGLLKSAPQGSRIVRTGGDEFLLMAVLPEDSKEPGEMGVKLDAGLEKYNRSHRNPFEVGVSYGWVLLPVKDGMTDLDEYIAMADEKMYEMKKERDEHRR
ncbi:MAG: sensor domain-containing diguanylate cyclase [Lachnospiraceae bacterium]|nr:sensor domain-containing diguanylate cyclase [Lachnospiraceae bacterium]